MARAEHLEVNTTGSFAVLTCSTRDSHLLISFSFDGHFDLIGKLTLKDRPLSLSKFRTEDVFMVADSQSILLYFADESGFYRLATISNIDPAGISAALVIPRDNEILALSKNRDKLVLLRK